MGIIILWKILVCKTGDCFWCLLLGLFAHFCNALTVSQLSYFVCETNSSDLWKNCDQTNRKCSQVDPCPYLAADIRISSLSLSLSSFYQTLIFFGFRSFLSPQIPSWLFSVIGEIPQRCVGYFINFASVWYLSCTHVHRFKWPRPRPKDPFVLLGMSWLAGASCQLPCTKLVTTTAARSITSVQFHIFIKAPLTQKAELSGGGTFSLPVLTSSVAAPPSVG